MMERKRASLVMCVTANGMVLPPALILKREKNLRLSSDIENNLNLQLYSSDNGWITSSVMIQWLQDILLPHIGQNKALLLLDSFPAHYSRQVLEFLSLHSNIFMGIIPGGLTIYMQPLDISIFAVVKTYIRQCSEHHQVHGAMENLKHMKEEKGSNEMGLITEAIDRIVIEDQVILTVSDKDRLNKHKVQLEKAQQKSNKKKVEKKPNNKRGNSIDNESKKIKVEKIKKAVAPSANDYLKVTINDLYAWMEYVYERLETDEGRRMIIKAFRVYNQE